jgi:hypothetical protein
LKYPVRLPSGVIIEVEDPQGLKEVLKALNELSPGILDPPSGTSASGPPRREVTKRHLLQFLVAVQVAGEKGARSKDLAKEADLHSGRSISGAIPRWTEFLAEHGIQFSDAAENFTVGRWRHWRPGPQLAEAIQLVKDHVQDEEGRISGEGLG